MITEYCQMRGKEIEITLTRKLENENNIFNIISNYVD